MAVDASTTDEDANDLPRKLLTIRNDRKKALRAEKDVPGAEDVDDARTAVRFVHVKVGVPKYQVVSTRVRKFPKGSDFTDVHAQDTVADWIEQNDPEVIDVADEPGFEGVGEEDL
jgi:hypothetical protein